MGKLWAVIRREYMERVRTRWFIFATIFGPVFFGALMFLPAVMASREKASATGTNVIIVDATGIGLGNRVAGTLAGGVSGTGTLPRVEEVSIDGIAQAESLATAEVMAERVKGYLLLDSNTVESGRARYAGSNTTALFDMQRIERAVQRELVSHRLVEHNIAPDVGRAITQVNANIETERLSKRGRGGSGAVNFFVGLAVAMLLYMTTFIYGLNVLRGVMEDKQTRGHIQCTRNSAACRQGIGSCGCWAHADASLVQHEYRAVSAQTTTFGALWH